ncbi:type II toxin-antitoxin system VapC family toxin [Thauera butanivorans]|uniref:type II toxin-antitoxin system VapC family toxin n=1 Tax=Thauera butanivorans TaxID=86174 RepID=UPI0008399042|nr:type II toxin-antitoxin system VapC family toxin [Thauera butanivorans]
MIVVDTSVISELWKIEPNPKVLAWIDAQAVETLYLSAITVAELCYGIATMPEGKRRTVYQQRLEHEVLPVFAGRVLPFDLDASRAYSDLMARARAAGKAIGEADGHIAATAAVHGLAVATCDTSPFQAAELDTINPWEAV